MPTVWNLEEGDPFLTVREMKEKLPKGTLEKLWSDPANWRGPFYYCKSDPRTLVPKRIRSLGWTINSAHPFAWIRLFIGIATTLGVILYLEKSGRGDWVFPALALMVIYSCVNGWYRSSTNRYEESR
jgi:hypothetical protein